MDKSSQGKPNTQDGAAAVDSALPGAVLKAPGQARSGGGSDGGTGSDTGTGTNTGAGHARQPGARGLSSVQHVVELADGLSTIADRLHERILRDIRGYDGGNVPSQVQDVMRSLLDDEMVLRQRANTLYADAATFVIQGLDQPQSRLVALTAEAAEKIRRIGVIGEVTSLVGGLLSLAGAVATGQPTPIVQALETIHHHSTVLDTLAPSPPTATA